MQICLNLKKKKEQLCRGIEHGDTLDSVHQRRQMFWVCVCVLGGGGVLSTFLATSLTELPPQIAAIGYLKYFILESRRSRGFRVYFPQAERIYSHGSDTGP